MDYQVENQVLRISQLYPELYTQPVAPQGEIKQRRRRKKSNGEGGIAARKRKLSAEQVNMLELNFGSEHKLESERKDRIASELGLDPRQVAVWFQNRRARWKSKKLEEEYSKLKAAHENVVVEKCRLESEVLKLKEQLSEAENQFQRLSDHSNMALSNSPSSSYSMDAVDPNLIGVFGVDAFESHIYPSEASYIHGMDWANLYNI